ncbi:uncharacterized protein LOC111117626 isoform X2 [Crassostrea virginica]|uniref:Uncharacterized protein LOC111117626 n=1 Tax=Crassostrea virginica TaxID=6565 RepID=A0A8B8CCV8_CRAVI|nr:uncharacterized protein LOC111117626 [Crassostrea virginica]
MEHPWDHIENDYPPHIMDGIEKFERSYLERERERKRRIQKAKEKKQQWKQDFIQRNLDTPSTAMEEEETEKETLPKRNVNRKSRRVGFLVIEPKEQEDNNANKGKGKGKGKQSKPSKRRKTTQSQQTQVVKPLNYIEID